MKCASENPLFGGPGIHGRGKQCIAIGQLTDIPPKSYTFDL